ncbi:MAG: dienelactone hydrolase family protein [Bdellovibrionaceae bacterium]|nr:dienelactone hydrolase family protein [Bdellovibrionales bacterium]MCB9086152.1 dienelactone hydrolase family protein [Pseudobdellovibrionaceae bacterium]
MGKNRFATRWTIFLIAWVTIGLVGFYHQEKLRYLLSKINLLGIATNQGFDQRHRGKFDYIGDFVVSSQSPYSLQDLLGEESIRERAKIKGSVLIPFVKLRSNSKERIPAVVFVPTSLGALKDRDRERLEVLNSMGIATAVFDSFTPRNVYGWTGHHSERLSNAMVLSDAFAVLKFLRENFSREIDPAKIAILGGSKGGEIALLAGWRPVVERLDPGGLGFAAHIAYYPFCYNYEDPRFTPAPMILFIGEEDNWALPDRCYEFKRQVAQSGGNILLKVYKNAYHGFDSLTPLRVIDGPHSREKCKWAISAEGSLHEAKMGLDQNSIERARIANRSCGEKGKVKIGGNVDAKRQSYLDLITFVNAIFRSE